MSLGWGYRTHVYLKKINFDHVEIIIGYPHLICEWLVFKALSISKAQLFGNSSTFHFLWIFFQRKWIHHNVKIIFYPKKKMFKFQSCWPIKLKIKIFSKKFKNKKNCSLPFSLSLFIFHYKYDSISNLYCLFQLVMVTFYFVCLFENSMSQ